MIIYILEYFKRSPDWPDIEITRMITQPLLHIWFWEDQGFVIARGLFHLFSWACISTVLSQREARLGKDSSPWQVLKISFCVGLYFMQPAVMLLLLSILVGRSSNDEK